MNVLLQQNQLLKRKTINFSFSSLFCLTPNQTWLSQHEFENLNHIICKFSGLQKHEVPAYILVTGLCTLRLYEVFG